MNRKKWLIAVAVVVAVALVGGLWALVFAGSPEPAQLPSSSGGTTATASAGATGSAGAQGTGSGTASGTAGAGQSGTGGSSSGSSGAGAGGSGQKTPVVPQTQPVALTQLSHLPTGTIEFFDAKKITPGSSYTVKFVPFGTWTIPHTLAITVSGSSPNKSVAHPFVFAGLNVLVDTSQIPRKLSVTKGGTYTGTIVLVTQRDVLLPRLTQATPSK